MQGAALQAERRGNFVVIGCVEGSRVVSWSLNVRTSVSVLKAAELTFCLYPRISTLDTCHCACARAHTLLAFSPYGHNYTCFHRHPRYQALNNTETVRLLASIELACYACKQAMADPAMHGAFRRRVARTIKDDRRRRHKRRKDQDAMIDAFAHTGLGGEEDDGDEPVAAPSAPPPAEPVPIPAPVTMPVPEPMPASGLGNMFPGLPPLPQ